MGRAGRVPYRLFACLIPCALCAPLLTVSFAGDASAQGRSVPTFAPEPGWAKFPPQWKVGDISSIATDAKGNVWVLHRPRSLKDGDLTKSTPPVMEFDPDGNFIRAWGGSAPGYEWVEREHGIHVDYKGFIWIGGNYCAGLNLPGLKPVSDDQLLKFTQDGKFVMQIGRSNQSKGNADTVNVHRAAEVWVHPQTNEAFVADGYGNHRVIVFDADTGTFKRMWGAFGNKPMDDDHCRLGNQKPDFANPEGPQNFNIVHSLRVADDGMVYVADRENLRVQAFTSEGHFVKQVIKRETRFARNVMLSPDQQFLYVGDGKEVAILDRKTLETLGAVKGSGMLDGNHLATTDVKGNIYIAATERGMLRLTFKGMSASVK
jgi:hypothetical protein